MRQADLFGSSTMRAINEAAPTLPNYRNPYATGAASPTPPAAAAGGPLESNPYASTRRGGLNNSFGLNSRSRTAAFGSKSLSQDIASPDNAARLQDGRGGGATGVAAGAASHGAGSGTGAGAGSHVASSPRAASTSTPRHHRRYMLQDQVRESDESEVAGVRSFPVTGSTTPLPDTAPRPLWPSLNLMSAGDE